MGNIDLKQKLPGSLNDFRLLYRQTLDNREEFWKVQAKRLRWQRDFTTVVQEDFSEAEISWFKEGKINATENALDRNIDRKMGDKKALTFYEDNKISLSYTYSELKQEVLKLAAAFKNEGLKEGDRIALNLPNSPEFIIATLAAAYLGITYLPIGCPLPAAQVAECIKASDAKMVIIRYCSACIDHKQHAETVHSLLPDLKFVTTGEKMGDLPTFEAFVSGADVSNLEPAYVLADHALFAMYGKRIAGKPVGTAFATGGFLVQAHTSFDAIFVKSLEHNEPEQILNVIDISKSAGHAYGLWGALTNGLGIIITDNDHSVNVNCVQTILEEQVNPAMICQPNVLSDIKNELNKGKLKTENRFSVIACCGDSLPPRLVNFADGVLVKAPEHVINMWMQSKSGTALINSYPSAELNRAGSLGFGSFGVEPLIMNDFGELCKTNVSGNLVFAKSWPAMARATWGAADHYKNTYFSHFVNFFQTNDGMRFDKDGFYWFMGRLDDVIKVKGQSLGTSLIESMIISHPLISEAAIINIAREAGEELVAFVVTKEEIGDKKDFFNELSDYIADKVGRFAVPARIMIARELPRTSTGKVVRRLLRRIASGDVGANEDISHVANTESVKDLVGRNEE